MYTCRLITNQKYCLYDDTPHRKGQPLNSLSHLATNSNYIHRLCQNKHHRVHSYRHSTYDATCLNDEADKSGCGLHKKTQQSNIPNYLRLTAREGAFKISTEISTFDNSMLHIPTCDNQCHAPLSVTLRRVSFAFTSFQCTSHLSQKTYQILPCQARFTQPQS